MRDYKYLQILEGKIKMTAFRQSLSAVRSPALKPCATVFADSMRRLKNLAVTPADVAYQVRRDTSLLCYSELVVTGKMEEPFTSAFEPFPKEVQEEFGRRIVKFVENLKEDQQGFLVREMGVRVIDAILEDTPAMGESMDALFASLVIGYWSAFETLAVDLWKAAVNNGPVELARRVQLATRGKTDTKDLPEHIEKNLNLDPRKDYAGAHVEIGNVVFRSLDKIVRWYSTTFEGAARQIFKDHNDIHAVAAFRNVLVHNSGKVDKDFIEQIKPVDDLRGTFTETQELELDGAFVARLRDATYATGIALVQLADNVLTPVTP